MKRVSCIQDTLSTRNLIPPGSIISYKGGNKQTPKKMICGIEINLQKGVIRYTYFSKKCNPLLIPQFSKQLIANKNWSFCVNNITPKNSFGASTQILQKVSYIQDFFFHKKSIPPWVVTILHTMIMIDNFVCLECRVPPCLCTMMILQLRCIQTKSKKNIGGLQLSPKRVFCIRHTLYGHSFESRLCSFMRLKPLTSKSCNHDHACTRAHTHILPPTSLH